MNYYINIWFFLMLVALVMNLVGTFVENYKWTIKFISIAVGIVSLILWNLTPRFFNMHGSVVFVVLMTWACAFIFPRCGLDLFMDFAMTVAAIYVGLLLIDGFSDKYTDWYAKNCCEEVLIVSPEKFEATIPEKTEDVRFVLGLEYYPLAVYKSTIDGEYTVEYFYETYDEIFGPGPHCIPVKDDARTVKVLPKEPGEKDHAIRYLYMADLKDKNTDYVIQTVFYNEYVFYLSEEVAERYNRERYQ